MADRPSEQPGTFFTLETPGFEGGLEQAKLLFAEVSRWLLEVKQDVMLTSGEILERIRHMYPQAHESLSRLVADKIAAQLDSQENSWGLQDSEA